MESSMILLSKRLIFLLLCVRWNVYGAHYPRNRLSKRTTVDNVPYTGQSVRLIQDDSNDSMSGRVEVYLQGRWSHLCADKWDLTVANAICKQLGFIGGAKATTTHNTDILGDTSTLTHDMVCPRGATEIQSCALNPNSCAGNKIAGVTCHENTGCPENWVAGQYGCYQLSTGHVTNRDFAVKRCALRGGHLATIENEAENHYLSHAFAGDLNGPLLTGGEKVGGTWMWEQVTIDDEPRSEQDIAATFSTLLKPVEASKWFPGWNGEHGEPSDRKKDRCLFLNNAFRHPNGSDINTDYFFWEAKICQSTKKTMSSGFKFICEKSRDYATTDVGCFSNDGSDYRGNAAHTDQGIPCIKWTEAPDINPITYPHTGLGDHNYCRNPDRDDKPWCWTSEKGEFGFCAIPRCTVDQNAVLQRQAQTGTKSDSCSGDEFTCSDQSCISSWWQCDMEADCQEAEDELNCDYKLHQFKKTEGKTIRYHTVETYMGTTNESCAKLCLSRDTFICRSFSFAKRTRECRLSDKNSLMVDPRPSRREDFYEVSYYLDDCAGMFKCNNGRCIQNDQLCNEQDECKDLTDELNCVNSNPLEIRLVGGGDSSGTVEVIYLGQTGVICDDRFDDRDAKVICRMLGFEGPATAVGGSYYGTGHGRFLVDELRCNGNESSLEQCRHSGWTNHDCFYWEVAGVECSLINDLQVELVGGEVNSGRIELVYDGIHGTICSHHWDDKDARVICRMMGYSDGIAHTDASFGAGNTSLHILLDDVECSGNEDTIADCARSDWLVNDCTHHEDAGVTCINDDATDNVITTATSSGTTTSTTATSTTTSTVYTSTETTPVAPSLSTSSPMSSQVPDIDCYNIASKYRGTIAQTETGKTCQRWSKDSPHRHKYHNDKGFPDGSASAARNYCRSPDNDTVPWCYTQDKRVRWGYCDVTRCGVTGSIQNQNVSCGARPMEAGRLRRDVTDEFEDLSNSDDNENDGNADDDDDESEIDTSMYRKMGRIMGGTIADYGMHPWQAGIRTVMSRFRGLHAHKCGATIIDEYWILSAAHCFRDLRKDRILIRTGDHNNERRDQYEQEFEADEVFLHAGYNRITYDYDIALIKLKPNNNHGIIFNEYVQPACLPPPNTKYEPGKKCHISGWGTTEDDLESAHLKSARVPIVDDLTCNRLYKWSITENMVCAGYIAGGIDSCTGDSGGPLVCDIDGMYTIMGITSFGEGCAVANAPGVYTRVAEFLSWINEKITENS